jgi:AhpD family alkylhydroperoxidase
MARLSTVSEESVSQDVRTVYDRVKTKFGTLLEPASVVAHHPEIFKAHMSYEGAFRVASRVDRKFKELAFLKVAALIGCSFCLDFGSAEARKAGITEEQMRALPRYRESSAFSDVEKTILDLATAMTVNPGQVSESLFSELQRTFEAPQIVEITAAIAWENYRSRFNRALGIEAHGFSAGSYCAVPESGT